MGEARWVQSAIVGTLCQIVGPKRDTDHHWHLCEIPATGMLPCPVVMLHAERLRYLRQLEAHGPDALWALIKADPTALAPLREAVTWLYNRVTCPKGLGVPAESWPDSSV